MPLLESPKVAMLRMQPTPRCNLNCSYCYIPAGVRRRKELMAPEVLEATLRRLVEEDLLEDRLAISWHGAEPLAAGLDWYRDAIVRVDRILGDHCAVKHVFQSNGVLIDEDWCRFFQEIGAQVGLSIDGDEQQNAARVNWAGRPAHRAAMRGAGLLNRFGLAWTLLAVVTWEVMRDPAAFVAFVRSTGCSALGFKVEETNVGNLSALAGRDSLEDAYRRFVQHLYRAFPEGGPIFVREFEEYRSMRGAPGTQAVPVTMIPFRNLTVGVNGDFTIFSGELLFREDDAYAYGNVLDGPLLDCLQTEKFMSVTQEMIQGARRCAANCPNYGECGSFFQSQKLAEHGTFDAEETLACRLEVKTFYAALDELTRDEAMEPAE
ncbi:MAG TPA: radical SAM protein [Sphingomonadaceae bacterium]|nr:radical SAM protein [Sphingomonadaceae bacterium]